jgi:hypothetical protein
MRVLIFVAAAALPFSSLPAADDPVEAFKSWSSFERLDVAELSAGKIATATNASMSLDRGLSAQAAYVVNGPIEDVAQTLLTFDPSKHSDLSSYQHRSFQGERDADFNKLELDQRIAAVGALCKLIWAGKGLQLSKDETDRVPSASSPEAAKEFLAGVLRQRWSQFVQRGDLGKSGANDSRSEIRSLLGEESKIASHFAKLLLPLTDQDGSGAPKCHYWDLANVNKTAAISLGAIYCTDAGDRRQMLDVVYFASSGYLAAITLYELVPVSIGGQERTLVWQGSLVSSNELPGGFGIKRKIASRIMVGDLEKWVRVLQRAAAKANR